MLTRTLEYRRAGFGVVDAAAAAQPSPLVARSSSPAPPCWSRCSACACRAWPTFAAFGFATAITVVAVMVTALMLVPALFALTRRWIEPRAVRRARKGKRVALRRHWPGPTVPVGARAERWARRVAGRPLPWLIGAATVMVCWPPRCSTCAPGRAAAATRSPGTPAAESFDLISEEFGPGANTPLMFVADREVVGDAEVDASWPRASSSLRHRQRQPRRWSRRTARSHWSPPSPCCATTTSGAPGQIADLRAELPDGRRARPGSSVMFSDIADILGTRIWLVIGFVVGISVLLLMVMFRSVLIPLKAAVMNLLSASRRRTAC